MAFLEDLKACAGKFYHESSNKHESLNRYDYNYIVKVDTKNWTITASEEWGYLGEIDPYTTDYPFDRDAEIRISSGTVTLNVGRKEIYWVDLDKSVQKWTK